MTQSTVKAGIELRSAAFEDGRLNHKAKERVSEMATNCWLLACVTVNYLLKNIKVLTLMLLWSSRN